MQRAGGHRAATPDRRSPRHFPGHAAAAGAWKGPITGLGRPCNKADPQGGLRHRASIGRPQSCKGAMVPAAPLHTPEDIALKARSWAAAGVEPQQANVATPHPPSPLLTLLLPEAAAGAKAVRRGRPWSSSAPAPVLQEGAGLRRRAGQPAALGASGGGKERESQRPATAGGGALGQRAAAAIDGGNCPRAGRRVAQRPPCPPPTHPASGAGDAGGRWPREGDAMLGAWDNDKHAGHEAQPRGPAWMACSIWGIAPSRSAFKSR